MYFYLMYLGIKIVEKQIRVNFSKLKKKDFNIEFYVFMWYKLTLN